MLCDYEFFNTGKNVCIYVLYIRQKCTIVFLIYVAVAVIVGFLYNFSQRVSTVHIFVQNIFCLESFFRILRQTNKALFV
jgi:hypothetical protein